MSRTVISIQNLGKKYNIHHQQAGPRDGLRHVLSRACSAPFRHFRSALHRSSTAAPASQLPETEEFWALKNVSFEIKEGDRLGIIGRNGAGKSTLLKILSRTTEPTEGRVRIHGRVASLLEVGTGFHPELTGRENIFLNGAILGMSRAEIKRKFDEIVDFSEVEKFIDTPVKRYSSGMYVRLAFAVAAHLESEILIVDEVLAVGDAEFQKKCLSKMQDASNRQGRTILVVSHFMETIKRLCGSALYLEQGRVAECSKDVASVVDRYFGRHTVSGIGEWINQGSSYDNPYFLPTRFWVSREAEGAVEGFFSSENDIWLNVAGIVEKTNPATSVGLAIYDEERKVVFWSFHNDQDYAAKVFTAGKMRLRLKIPRHFLNEGQYRVELMSSIAFVRWLFGEPGDQCPALELKVVGGFSTSPYWVAQRPGAVAPVFNWQLQS
jgi:lipopolysaccharide transport system ATP-binding protein